MTINVTTNPVPSSGSLSFSTLRNILKETTSGSVKLSDYYRNGGIVPSASVNTNIPTSGAISLSKFRGAISKINTTITGVELILTASNLFKNPANNTSEYGYNIRKIATINGTVTAGGNLSVGMNVDAGSPSPIELNIVSGGIFGGRGTGGAASASGNPGSAALLLNASTKIYGSGAIRAGGGGGGGGGTGGTEGQGGANYQGRCCGWFCPNQSCGDCNRGIGSGNNAGGAGGAGGSGTGYIWNGSTLTLASTTAQGGSNPGNGGGAGGTGGSGGGWATNGQAGQTGQTGATGPGGNCKGGTGGQAGQAGGSGGTAGTSVVNANYVVGGSYGGVSVS